MSLNHNEDPHKLTHETQDMHHAITSMMEELEAVDLYNQRVALCQDESLRAILEHNRDEEKEHMSMLLEWIRSQDPAFDRELRDSLFANKPIDHDTHPPENPIPPLHTSLF